MQLKEPSPYFLATLKWSACGEDRSFILRETKKQRNPAIIQGSPNIHSVMD